MKTQGNLQEDKKMYCPDCKKGYPGGMRFCMVCGRKLIEIVSASSDSCGEMPGGCDVALLKEIDDYIGSNDVAGLERIIPRLATLAAEYSSDEVLYRYNMLLAALNPLKLILEYETKPVYEYWRLYWVAVAYIKLRQTGRAGNIISLLGQLDRYPNGNMAALSALDSYYNSEMQVAKDCIADISQDQCTVLLLPFVKALFIELQPGHTNRIAVNNATCRFYTDCFLTSYNPNEETRCSIFETKDFTVNGVAFTMKGIRGGTFFMGSNDDKSYADERPVHIVSLGDYCIAESSVTQALWQAVMGTNPSHFKGEDNPVECVSYNECLLFIDRLNSLLASELPEGRKFRLPTEAEWEFAACGGNKGKGLRYSGTNKIVDVAWCCDNSDGMTHPVKSREPNEFGLYDMSGNVCEWCNDWYDQDFYSSSQQNNPQGPFVGSCRVIRGGSWSCCTQSCRVTERGGYSPDSRYTVVGLRLAL